MSDSQDQTIVSFHPSSRVVIAAAVVLVAVAFVTYYPGLKMGFYLDDYNYLERAGRTDWANALAQIFDPRLQTMWYRPLQAVQFFIEYQVFGANANAYHMVNMGFHAVNLLLIYGLVWRVSRRWLVGFAGALFFASFSVYASGINWIGIVDPLTAVFYLLTLWFWWTYLERGDRVHYMLALSAFILALLCKQISITLPVVMFLAEWWLQRKPLDVAAVVRRYGPFVLGVILFSLVQYTTQSTHTFAGVFGWQVGATMAFILVQYLVLFFFPWGIYPSLDINQVEAGDLRTYAWLVVALCILVVVLWRTRSRVLLFLGAFTLLNLFPVLPFPFIEHRYLYIPIISAAVMLALVFAAVYRRWGRRLWFLLGAPAALVVLLIWTGLSVDVSAASAAEWARQLRVPFRDIERQHATFPEDTLLYFVDPITPTTGGLSGMFFMRYGRAVSVKNWTDYAGLREHNTAYIYYFDEGRRPREVAVQKDAVTIPSARLPVGFQSPIRLVGYEVAATTIKRGEPLIVLLYWRGTGPLETRYTVFLHLLDAQGRVVAGYDSEPRKGQYPTTAWEPNLLTADVIVMPVGSDVAPGSNYRLEVGLYDAATGQRLAIVDLEGRPVTDVFTIDTFKVEP